MRHPSNFNGKAAKPSISLRKDAFAAGFIPRTDASAQRHPVLARAQ